MAYRSSSPAPAKMSEGRKTQVVLLDDRRLDLLVQPKLYSTELLDIVASHFNLKEKEYFDLSFKDETGHHHWLHLDRKVLEHEFPKKTGPLVLYFGVRFFIESIGYLRDSATVELFFLQAKQSVFKAHLEVDSETAFELAAYVLQAQHGDFTDDETAKKQLKKLPVLPTSVLREHPSLGYCEEQVLAHYRKLEGHTRGSAIVNYMTIIESLPTYGIHYYEVKDKSGIPWWLGLSHKGISLYDYADKRVPRRVFAWKQLENLYFRDKKFSIEVHDPKRIVHTLSSFNLYEDAIQEPLEEFDELSDAISDPTTQVSVSRRTFGPGNVNVHAWLASTPLLTKCIWSMAVSQHQFYLDRKQSKSQLPQVRSMSEIASDLCHSSTSLHSHTNSSDPGLSRSNSAHSLTLSTYNSRAELTPEALEASRAAYKEMFHALQARKEALEEALRKKTEELKQICLKEGELTGVLPAETPLAPGETLPPIRRRVGTSFALSPKIIDRDKTSEVEEALARLELDLELQDKISKAAYKLAQDKSVAKSVRKQRKQHYHKSHQKLKDIEKKLNEYRERIGKIPMRLQSSVEDLSEDSREFLDSEPEFISPIGSPSLHRHSSREATYQHHANTTGRQRSGHQEAPASAPQHKSAPASPVRQPQGAPRVSSPSPNPGRHGSSSSSSSSRGGYIPNSVYSTRTQYRAQMYPTYSTTPQGSQSDYERRGGSQSDYERRGGSQSDYENSSRGIPSNRGHHVSRADRENNHRNDQNLYNVGTNKMATYDSTDELKSPGGEESEDYDSYSSDQEGPGRWPGYHGDLQPRGYGSLDRNLVGGQGHNLPLTELSPSKFGSKRESHSDYRDSPYQIVDMPPIPRNLSGDMALNGYRQTMGEGPPQGSQVPPASGPSSTTSPQDDASSHNTSIPYIDCSQSSISVPSTGPWYDPKDKHWTNGPSTHYEPTPPVGSNPAYQPPTGTNMSYPRPEPTAGHYEKVPGGFDHTSPYQSPPPEGKTTVTKYQSYVEVSKPFEMSDFYKYSERLRRQRFQDNPGAEGSPHHTGPHSRTTPHTGGVPPPTGPPQGTPGRTYHRPAHPSGYNPSRSRPESPYSDPSYKQSSYPDPAYNKQSSPYPSPHSSGGSPSIVQTSYHPQQASYPQHHSPKHVAYQPPKPQTCQPIRGDSSSSSSPAHNTPHTQHRQV